MKTTLLALLFTGHFGSEIFAGKPLPQAIKARFEQQFPGASIRHWEKEGPNFEIDFVQNQQKSSALFDPDGKFLEQETEVPQEQVPAAALQYAKNHYPQHKIKETARITDHLGKVTFEIEVAGHDVIFDAQGQVIATK